MTDPRTLTQSDLEDILNGACILGAGGGGPYALGKALLDGIVKHGAPVRLAEPADMPRTASTAVAAGVGSPEAAASGFPFDAATRAFDALAEGRPEPFSYVLPGEVGAANSLLPMTVAVSKGIPVLDAAGAPRAIPALDMCTYASRGAPIGTVVLANATERLSFDAPDAGTADTAMRGIVGSGTFKEDAGVALWAMDGDTVRRTALAGTTERARALGAALRAGGSDPVQAVTDFLGGRVLFRGAIASQQEQTTGGFDLGSVVLAAGGRSFRIVNQNENLVAWSDAATHPVALAPDLICYLTADGRPFSNADVSDPCSGEVVIKGEVAVIGAPVDAAMRDLVDAFLPVLRQAGYGGPYEPIEQLWDG
jgi:uncharacterized protein